MRQLNGFYTQRFNRRHGLSGHLYQGRYKATDTERKIPARTDKVCGVNPLWADMVKKLEDWPWSSCLATINAVSAREWLDVDWLLGQFGKQRQQAIRAIHNYATN
jgi:REP-associated tyrosine transposase